MLAALVPLELSAIPSMLSGAGQTTDRHRSARRLTLCPGVDVVLDLWRTDPDVFRPRPIPPQGWKALAACRGLGDELFFRGSTVGPQTRRRSLHEARTLCTNCPVIRKCLVQAFSVPEHFGVWGGTSARQRESMLEQIEAGQLTVSEAVDACLP